MKKVKKVLSFLLVFCMILTIMPMGVYATDLEESSAAADDLISEATPTPVPAEDIPADDPVEEDPTPAPTEQPTPAPAEEPASYGITPYSGEASVSYRIAHLDCGRKYFTKAWIIALINEMAADGYNQLQLAFGNDGLRFLLDDMTFTANGTTYSHDSVVSAVESGNAAQNSSGDGRWLTQSDMDEIIAAANAKGIEIVPLLNLPGHANALLDIASDTYNYSSSQNTLNVTNDSAVNFAYALFTKYVDYFAGKGCKFFNFGADEFANDMSGSNFSFGALNSAQYDSFISFVNQLAGYIESKGMTPRAFNDGLYYGTYSNVSIDTNIQCCYWSNGWNGYNVAAPATIAGKGHAMINTHGNFYYVLGKSDQFDSGYSYASNFSNTAFMGDTVSNPVGSMFCIWCDYPNAETETEIAQNTRLVLRAMAKRMNNESIDGLDTSVVSGGFNADGTIHVPENTETAIQAVGVDFSAVPVDKTFTLALSSGESATWTTSDDTVISLSSAARSTEITGASVTATARKAGTATITATVGDATYAAALTVSNTATDVPAFDKTITLEVGKTDTITQEGVNNRDKVDKSRLNTNIATVEVTGKDATTTYTKASVTCNTLISGDSKNWMAASGYYYTPDGTNYYPVYAKRSSVRKGNILKYTEYTYTWGYKVGDSEPTQIGDTQVEGSRISDGRNETPSITVYRQSVGEGTPASTTITFTGVYPGTTYVTVGETTYKIVVNYKTETVNLVIDGTETRSQNRPITGDPQITGDTNAVEVSVSGSSITFRGLAVGTATVTVGDTIYTVNVTEEDLNNASPLTVDFWITNRPVDVDGLNEETVSGDTTVIRRYYAYPATTEGMHSETGMLFSDLVPATGKADDSTMAFWKGTRLASNNKQTNDPGVDKTKSGDDFTYIRYWNGSWAYSSDGKTWTSLASDDQIVAYYLQVTDVTDEIDTQVVDWGPKKANWSGLNYLIEKYVLMDYTVKYESGEETPSSFPTSNSLAFHCDTSTKVNGYFYRSLGMVRAVETADYEVYMITLTPTSDNPDTNLANTAAANSRYSYQGTEVVAWAATQDDLDSSGLGTYTSISGAYTYSIGGDPIVSGLEIYRQHGMKVTFYVRAKVTEDSLAVHYIDQTANQEFYSYNIAVKSGTLFDENIRLADPWKGNLVNGSITNSLDKTQTVSADLSTMPAIGAQYRYSDYTCVRVERSQDGKDVYLYYTFNNTHSFVIDFGLPLNISTDNLGIEGDWTDASISGAQYGTATTSVGKGITYTPTQTLKGVETLQLTLKDNDGVSVTHQIYIYPATTVYYEEGFATYEGGWNDVGSKGTGNQTASTVGSKARYGFDSKYASEMVGKSNGTEATCAEGSTGQTATFEFTGTGVEIYTNNTRTSGSVMASIYNATTNAHVKTYIVHTAMKDGDSDATHGQNVTAYNVPIISARDLAYGRYKVVIKHVKSSASDTTIAPVSIDGFRVHGTLASDTQAYVDDLEDNPTFIELRDKVLAGLNVNGIQDSQYKVAGEIIQQVYDKNSSTEGAVVLSNNGTYSDSTAVQDLLDNGPKNELYLQKNQAVVFKVTTNRVVQIGLKALNANTTYTINSGDPQTLSTSTDMFYTVVNAGAATNEQTITITNTGTGILSITLVKICDDPNAAFASLTEEDLIPALLSLGFEDKATSTPEPTAEPTIEPTATPEPTAEPTPVVTPTPAPTNPPKPVVPNNPIQDFFNAVRNILNKWFGW